MLEKINDAFGLYKIEMEKEIRALLEKGTPDPCECCAKNIALMQNHEDYNPQNPNVLRVEAESDFTLDYEHLTRLSEHAGMPVMTSHDFCKNCFTNFYYEFEGFDSDHIYEVKRSELSEIKEYESFIAHHKNLYFQKFAPFLKNYFKGKVGDVTLYISLDEHLKRKNHDYLVSYYTKQGEPLEKLDIVGAYLSEKELYTASRIGWLYEKEFLQKITYPLDAIQFDFSLYSGDVELEIDVKKIKERTFFDVYRKAFVPFEALDLTSIHMIKRNADTYALFKEVEKSLNLDSMTSFDEIEHMFENFFEGFQNTVLHDVFGTAFEAHLQEQQKKKKEFQLFFDSLSSFGEEYRKKTKQQQEEKPTSLHGFQAFDHVLVKEGIYQNMKGCIKEINFNKETIGIVFFGETNFDNIIHLDPAVCEKI